MLHELKTRLQLPTPAFWKKVQRRTAAASVAFGALTVTVSSIANHLPAILPTILGYATAFFGGIAAMTMLTVDDPAQIPAEPLPAEPTPNAPTGQPEA